MARRLAALLLAVVVPPAVTLAWLGVRLLEHDRVMLEQRELERRQAGAQAVARMLEQALRRVDEALTTEVVPDGIVRLTATSRGIEVRPAEAVLWLPSVRQLKTVPRGRFADAERLEFQSNAGGALLLYERLARSTDRAVRAGALLRQARIHRREGRWRDALGGYERLAAFPDIGIEGTPSRSARPTRDRFRASRAWHTRRIDPSCRNAAEGSHRRPMADRWHGLAPGAR